MSDIETGKGKFDPADSVSNSGLNRLSLPNHMPALEEQVTGLSLDETLRHCLQ